MCPGGSSQNTPLHGYSWSTGNPVTVIGLESLGHLPSGEPLALITFTTSWGPR